MDGKDEGGELIGKKGVVCVDKTELTLGCIQLTLDLTPTFHFICTQAQILQLE